MAENWTVTSMKKCAMTALKTPQLLIGPDNISLNNVLAYDIEIETTIGNKRKGHKAVLYGVPLFLVEAFTWLENHNAINEEGIFRKPGNECRLRNTWQIFSGRVGIPNNYTIHDVCTLVKRFFSALKRPIMAELQSQITSTITQIANERVRTEAVLSFIDQLPPNNQATLGYLMRQLKKISENSEQNQMNAHNLSLCFAPSLFNDNCANNDGLRCTSLTSSIWASSSSDGFMGRSFQLSRKKKPDTMENLQVAMFAKQNKSLQAAAVQLLIQYANHIGSRHCRAIMAPTRGFLQRKNSDMNHRRSTAAAVEHHPTPTKATATVQLAPTTATNQEQQRGRTTMRTPSRRDKIWPRSSSENPFNRTRAALLFHLPFGGKIGSFAPSRPAHNTPMVHQNKPAIPCKSPAATQGADDGHGQHNQENRYFPFFS